MHNDLLWGMTNPIWFDSYYGDGTNGGYGVLWGEAAGDGDKYGYLSGEMYGSGDTFHDGKTTGNGVSYGVPFSSGDISYEYQQDI